MTTVDSSIDGLCNNSSSDAIRSLCCQYRKKTYLSIRFYPTISCGEIGKYSLVETALLPVSSWAASALRRQEKKGLSTDQVIGKIPVPKLPSCMTHIAADCGGFVATFKWNGIYKYSVEQYIEWLDAVQPSWAAMRDFCCEDEITTAKDGIIRERQQLTTDMAYRMWSDYKDKPWVWVPTIQGWTVDDYIRHAIEMKPLIEEMKTFYDARGQGEVFRVGIGTLCHRASAMMISLVVSAVTNVLKETLIHLWGVKLGVFKLQIPLSSLVVSVDSAAWNGMFGHGRNLWKLTEYSQRQWCFKVALPAYEAKIRTALQTPKQMSLEDWA